MPRPLDEVVAVRKHPEGGVVLHDVVADEPLIRLDDLAGLALADDLTLACQRPLRAVAA
jgi:hypothetical protein